MQWLNWLDLDRKGSPDMHCEHLDAWEGGFEPSKYLSGT